MSDKGEVICEQCSSSLTNKMVSKTSFSLKGKGWYRDNYSGNSSKPAKEK